MPFGARVTDINELISEKGEPKLPKLTVNLKDLKDGEHVVAHDENSGKLVARVKQGTVVEWLAYNKQGAQVPSLFITKPATGGGVERLRAQWYIVCECVEGNDNLCWWVFVIVD
jgi:hypothetical protein